MASSTKSNRGIGLCCFAFGRKRRKCSKDTNIRLQEQQQISEIYDDTSVYQDTCSVPGLSSNDSYHAYIEMPPANLTACSLQRLDDTNIDLQRANDEDNDPVIVREDSSSVSSFGGVVSRISLSGSVSSSQENMQTDIEGESSEQVNNELPDLASLTTRKLSKESELNEEQRMSWASSGYGSMKENIQLSTGVFTEVCDIPLDENLQSVCPEEIQNSKVEAEENIGSLRSSDGISVTQNSISTDIKNIKDDDDDDTESDPLMDKRELPNILKSIKDTLKNENLKPIDLTGRSVQLPNFSAKYLTNKGGKISIPGTRISLYVPPDALDATEEPILVYVYLHPKPGNISDLGNDRKWLTPNVECGPHGLAFNKEVFLTMPHYAVNPKEWEFRAHQAKAEDATPRTLRDAVVVTKYEVTMLLNHFCSHGCSGTSSSARAQEVRKWMKAGVLFRRQDDRHTEMSVRLFDIDCLKHLPIETESFPISESANKVFVVIKGLNLKWQLDEEPIKEIPASDLWTNEKVPEVTFATRLKANEQKDLEESLISCTLDVFQHHSDHPGATLNLQIQSPRVADLHKEPTPVSGSIQIKFLHHQEDLTPTCGCGISDNGFRNLCILLENADDCGKGWKALADKIGITEYQYVLNIEQRAQWTKRSPAVIVLDFFFKENCMDPLDGLKRLSNILCKIDNLAAQELVDKEIQAIIDRTPSRRSSSKAQNHQQLKQAEKSSLVHISSNEASACPCVEGDNPISLGPGDRKKSLRTSLLISSIQNKIGKLTSSNKKKRRTVENNNDRSQENSGGESNDAFEEDLDKTANESCGPKSSAEENSFGLCEVTTDAEEGKKGNGAVPRILLSLESDLDEHYNNSPKSEYVDEHGEEAHVNSFNHQGLTSDPSDSSHLFINQKRDSGISSISSGSRDSWKSVHSNHLSVHPKAIEEEC